MLHIVNKSPYENNALNSCIKHVNEGDSILLIEDATVAVIKNSSFSEQIFDVIRDKKLYVLSADLYARGITEEKVITGVEYVDYEGFVDLTVENSPIQSWL